jgi:hypothetical protein
MGGLIMTMNETGTHAQTLAHNANPEGCEHGPESICAAVCVDCNVGHWGPDFHQYPELANPLGDRQEFVDHTRYFKSDLIAALEAIPGNPMVTIAIDGWWSHIENVVRPDINGDGQYTIIIEPGDDLSTIEF